MKNAVTTSTHDSRPHAVNSIRFTCMLLALGLVGLAVHTANAQPVSVTVTNFSFETVGTSAGGEWNSLPASGWTDPDPANSYQILDLASEASHFPSYNVAPGGTRVLYLVNASPLVQNLGYAVSAGDVIAVSYVLGESASSGFNPGNVAVAILVDGIVSAAETNANTAANGDFAAFRSVLTATSSGNLSVRFTNSSSNNWLDLVDVVVVPAAEAAAGQTPVGNFSFETEGTLTDAGTGWYKLPAIGSWKGPVSSYQIIDLTVETSHFPSYNAAPEGVNVLNLTESSPVTNDLGTAISSGQEVTIDFHLGDSATQTPGTVTVAILVNGVVDASETIANTAANGGFKAFQSVLTATSSGNLSIRFSNSSGENWLDNVNVKVKPFVRRGFVLKIR